MAVIIVAAALLIGLASRPKADGSSGAVPEAANALRIPIQGAVGSVVEWMRGIYGYIYRYDKLLAENESLRRQLAEAQEQVRSSQDALEENTRLRTMLGYLEKNTTFKTEAAMITSWDASNWTSAFTISKGTDNGIEQGDCVITESGMLVGQVYELGKNYASVRTVIDVNMDAGVLVGESLRLHTQQAQLLHRRRDALHWRQRRHLRPRRRVPVRHCRRHRYGAAQRGGRPVVLRGRQAVGRSFRAVAGFHHQGF